MYLYLSRPSLSEKAVWYFISFCGVYRYSFYTPINRFKLYKLPPILKFFEKCKKNIMGQKTDKYTKTKSWRRKLRNIRWLTVKFDHKKDRRNIGGLLTDFLIFRSSWECTFRLRLRVFRQVSKSEYSLRPVRFRHVLRRIWEHTRWTFSRWEDV